MQINKFTQKSLEAINNLEKIALHALFMYINSYNEHKIRYKKNIPQDVADQIWNDLFRCAEDSAELDKRMESIQNKVNAY